MSLSKLRHSGKIRKDVCAAVQGVAGVGHNLVTEREQTSEREGGLAFLCMLFQRPDKHAGNS